jgi:hypothetical protein
MTIRVISRHGTTAIRCSKCGKHPRSLMTCRNCDTAKKSHPTPHSRQHDKEDMR